MSVATPPFHEEVPESPSRRRHRRRWPSWLRWALLGAVIVFLVVVTWYEFSIRPLGGPGAPETIHVSTGESYNSAITSLQAKGVVAPGLALTLFNAIHGTPTVQPGYYTIPKNSTFQAINDILGNGPNTAALVVPAGFTIAEVESRLKEIANPTLASQVVAVFSNGSVHSPFEPTGSTNLEGLIAPGVYVLPPTETAKGLVQAMVDNYVTMAAKAGLTPTTTKNGFDAYQLATTASVVEKEGYYTVNMSKVATVIYNRINHNIPLQMNATVLYALHQDGGPFTSADLKYQSPYNSYLNHGLPPTPICVPSQQALNATMNPAPGQWLYFVLTNKNGTMSFSNTYAEQLANEALARSRGL